MGVWNIPVMGVVYNGKEKQKYFKCFWLFKEQQSLYSVALPWNDIKERLDVVF